MPATAPLGSPRVLEVKSQTKHLGRQEQSPALQATDHDDEAGGPSKKTQTRATATASRFDKLVGQSEDFRAFLATYKKPRDIIKLQPCEQGESPRFLAATAQPTSKRQHLPSQPVETAE